MEKQKKNWIKYSIGFLVCLLIRLIPFRPPNIEPILATQMPFSKAYGKIAGFLFAFFSIFFFDLIVNKVGMWTFITGGVYGLLAFFAVIFFKNRKSTALNYAIFSIIGTLFFDGITGLSIGPIFFNQPFLDALMGQIPFTLLHLLGNVSFALVLSPALYTFVIQNKKFESSFVYQYLTTRKI